MLIDAETPANCKRAHEHTETNTYRYGSRRECKDCRRFYWRMYSRKARATAPKSWRVVSEPEESAIIALGGTLILLSDALKTLADRYEPTERLSEIQRRVFRNG